MLKNKIETVYEEYEFCAHFTADDIKIGIAKFKKGKALGSDGVFPEHMLYAGDALVYALTDLFSLYIIHGFLPVSFSSSVIVPVVKNGNGDASKCSNYRPVSSVTMFCKVLELCLFSGLEFYLKVDELQFGFVPNKGCQKDLFTLESIGNYFTDRCSSVYVALLDVSKALDRLITALFIKLIDLGIPLYVLNVLINWYCKLTSCFQ